METRRVLNVLVLAPLLLACNPDPGPLSEAERAELESVIVDRMDAYLDAGQSMDPALVSELYSESPDFLVYSDGVSMSRQAVLEAYGGMRETLQSFEAIWERIEVTPLGRDVALASAEFTRVLTDNLGDAVHDWGTVTWVWVLEGDRWLLLHGQAVHYPVAEG